MAKGKKKQTKQKECERNRRDSSTSTTSEQLDTMLPFFQKFGNMSLGDSLSTSSATSVHSKSIGASKPANRPKGLSNLGNTCYFNSVIQVLYHTPMLLESFRNSDNSQWTAIRYQHLVQQFVQSMLENPSFKQEDEDDKSKPLTDSSVTNSSIDADNLVTQLSPPSLFSSCFFGLLQQLKSKNSPNVITPNSFLREVNRVLTRFRGYDQQDSHEFLRCLLDAIKSEEIKRQQTSILKTLNIDIRKKALNAENEQKVKQFSFASNHTLIDAFFGGYCVSSLKCEKCESTSQIFEPFFDLSLPITEDKPHEMRRRTKKNTKEESESEKPPKSDPDLSHLIDTDVRKLSPKQRKQRRKLKNQQKNKSRKQKNEQTTPTPPTLLNADSKMEDEQVKSKVEDQTALIGQKKVIVDGKDSLDDDDDSRGCDLPNGDKKESDGECSDDEASGKDFDDPVSGQEEHQNNLSDSPKADSFSIPCEKILPRKTQFNKLQRTNTNSTDSGINYTTFTSDGDVSSLVSKPDPMVEEPEVNFEHNDTKVETKPINDDNSGRESEDNANGEKACLSVADAVEADSESEESSLNNGTESEMDRNGPVNATRMTNEEAIFDLRNEKQDKRIRTNSSSENVNEMKRKAKWVLSTISEKSDTGLSSPSILSCLSHFTSPELLVGANRINCENCSLKYNKNHPGQEKKVYTNASKRMLIALPPAILTLHLKRFEVSNNRMSLCKVNRHIPFPLTFDLSPYVSNLYKVISKTQSKDSNDSCKEIIYSLYAIVEHGGSLRSGHYRAYVRMKNAGDDQIKKFIHLRPFFPKMDEILEMVKLDHIDQIDCETSVEEALSHEKLKEKLPKFEQQHWFNISDSSVSPVTLTTVLKAQAFLLFYERIC